MNTSWIKAKPATSLRQAARRAVVQAVMMTVALGAGFVGMSSLNTDPQIVFPESHQAPAVQTQQTQDAQAATAATARCADYPAGTIPGHAVVSLPGQGVQYVPSKVGFNLWGPDEKHGTADDRPGTLHQFCA